MVPTSFLSEAELHGLVDGRLDAVRRTELLQRVAASPFDRERVASWQEQGDLLRAAFRGVEREVLPAELDLRSPPARVYSLPARGASQDAPDSMPPVRASAPGRTAWRRLTVYAVATTVAALCVGSGTAWIVGASPPVAEATVQPERDTPDAVLALRTLAALGGTSGGQGTAGSAALPTTLIPDLTTSGFAFSGAEPQGSEPASIVFRYRNAAAEQVVVGVARVARDDRRGTPSQPAAGVYAWRSGARTFAVAGTLPRERLRAIAVLLKGDTIDE